MLTPDFLVKYKKKGKWGKEGKFAIYYIKWEYFLMSLID